MRESFTRKYPKLNKNTDAKMIKRKHVDIDQKDFYTPLKRTKAGEWNSNEVEPGFSREELLQRSDGVPITTMTSVIYLVHVLFFISKRFA